MISFITHSSVYSNIPWAPSSAWIYLNVTEAWLISRPLALASDVPHLTLNRLWRAFRLSSSAPISARVDVEECIDERRHTVAAARSQMIDSRSPSSPSRVRATNPDVAAAMCSALWRSAWARLKEGDLGGWRGRGWPGVAWRREAEAEAGSGQRDPGRWPAGGQQQRRRRRPAEQAWAAARLAAAREGGEQGGGGGGQRQQQQQPGWAAASGRWACRCAGDAGLQQQPGRGEAGRGGQQQPGGAWPGGWQLPSRRRRPGGAGPAARRGGQPRAAAG